jgi:hypothetical protein
MFEQRKCALQWQMKLLIMRASCKARVLFLQAAMVI